MAPKYKLIYFDIRARGEIIRLIFTVAGVEFEDVRLKSFKEFDDGLKPGTHFGQLPILEWEDKSLCQSIAIARFLAHKFGLAGKDEYEQARTDMMMACYNDMSVPLMVIFKIENSEEKARLKKKYIEEDLPFFFTKLEALLKSNNGGDGYFVGDSLTWADLGFMDILDYSQFIQYTPDVSPYPKLSALLKKLYAHPKIAAWRESHPHTKIA